MRFLACAIGAVALTSVMVQAQWPTFKTQGVPRTRSGEINLAAPAPKAPDGKPDLSGLWAAEFMMRIRALPCGTVG